MALSRDHQDYAPLPPDEIDALTPLVVRLAELDQAVEQAGSWDAALWRELGKDQAHAWTVPTAFGGEGASRSTLLHRYARVAEGSMTAALVLTQHDAAVRRLVSAWELGHVKPAERWLAPIARGEVLATVGISQLTTSKRLGPRALTARPRGDGSFLINGMIPWVTSAGRANLMVIGAVLENDHQILAVMPTQRAGVNVAPPFEMAALSATHTTEIRCDEVRIDREELLMGPIPDVMATLGSGGTGGLETSATALGQARAALNGLRGVMEERGELSEPIEALEESWRRCWYDLIVLAEGGPNAASSASIRARANGLATRTTQAWLATRKGSGFLLTDPAQRWARQALMFLVWSCPSPVASASIRDLAGICPV